MRGRKRTSNVLNFMRGNPSKRKSTRAEPKVAAGSPACPSHLNRLAKQEWRRIMKDAPAGLVTKLDRTTLALYCQNWSRIVELEKIVDELGYTYNMTGGTKDVPTSIPCARPEVGMIKGLQTLQNRIVEQLGFSPSSRSRVTISEPPKTDETEKGLFGSRGA